MRNYVDGIVLVGCCIAHRGFNTEDIEHFDCGASESVDVVGLDGQLDLDAIGFVRLGLFQGIEGRHTELVLEAYEYPLLTILDAGDSPLVGVRGRCLTAQTEATSILIARGFVFTRRAVACHQLAELVDV